MTTSTIACERVSQVVHRSTTAQSHKVRSAKGMYLTLESGRQILDGAGGAAVACLGHGRTDIAEAVQKQMMNVSHTYAGANLTSQPAEDLAQLLLKDSFDDGSQAFFCTSGSEATEAALKFALQYWREKGDKARRRFVSRRQSYHGNTLGALSVSGIESRRANYTSFMSSAVSYTEPCFPYRGQLANENDQDYIARLASDLEKTLHDLGPHTVAGFILETVGGSSIGCVTPTEGYLKAVAAVCRKYDVLLILDEVMCGMGRTGTFHAWQTENFEGPDIQTIGKALGGGFIPLSAVLLSSKITKAIASGSGRVAHSQTFQAHSVACAAALAVQHAIKSENLVENVRAMGVFLSTQLRATLSYLKYVGDVRGRGLFWAVEFVADKQTKRPFPQGRVLAPRVTQKAFENGLSIQTGICSTDPEPVDCVIISPPYIVTSNDVSCLVAVLRRSIVEAIKEQCMDRHATRI